MQLQINIPGSSQTKQLDVPDAIFAQDFNEALIHQVVTAYFAGGRQGSRQQKTRDEVRGGGKKPWKQKGTGRARAGSIRSPIWVGGGRAHPSTPEENFTQKVNRKMYKGALRSILSELYRQQRLIIVDSFNIEAPKTKLMVEKLTSLGVSDVLIVTDTVDEILYLATRNLYHVGLQEASTVDPVSLVGFQKVIMTVAAVKQLEERLA